MSTSKLPGKRKQIVSQDECYVLLTVSSVKAMHFHKAGNLTEYEAEITSIAKSCTLLINCYAQSPQSIITFMESVMSKAFLDEVEEIDKEIRRLFNKRKVTPINTFYGEREITNLTTQMTALELRKNTPIKEVIKAIIHNSLSQAIKNNGVEFPVDFNLNQYEYNPDQLSSSGSWHIGH